MNLRSFFRLCTAGSLLAGGIHAAEGRLELGANFNEHWTRAGVASLDATGVTWIRGFLPVGEFIDVPRESSGEGNSRVLAKLRSLDDDEDVAAFREAAASGRKVIVSLKWDFKRTRWRVPAPDSGEEKRAFDFAVELAKRARPDAYLLVNEVFIDTHEQDLLPGKDGEVPFVRFMKRLTAHVSAAKLAAPDGKPLPLGSGGFTRLERPAMREHPTTLALLPWLATEPALSYVNYHLHEPTLEAFESAATFLRSKLPDRPFIVTEFSLVWAFHKGMGDTIGSTVAGRAFAEKFGVAPGQTCAAFLSAAAKKPIEEAKLHAFLASREWFDPQTLERMCSLMERNGVVLATYAYLQASSGLEREGAPIGKSQPPWRLNPIFQERHAFVPGENRLARQLGFYDTFMSRIGTKPDRAK